MYFGNAVVASDNCFVFLGNDKSSGPQNLARRAYLFVEKKEAGLLPR